MGQLIISFKDKNESLEREQTNSFKQTHKSWESLSTSWDNNLKPLVKIPKTPYTGTFE